MKKFSTEKLLLSISSPAEKKRVVKEANKILAHQFEVLSKKILFGQKINWRTNFSGKSWPCEPYSEFRANNYDFDSKKYLGDIKLPWELNKHLYLQDLAKAYLATKNEKYAQEFVDEITDWLRENPYEVGVNWTEGLIASHRAISWIIALGTFAESDLVDSRFLERISSSIYQHALFIEKTYEFCGRASNHLLGELCTQIVISTLFPDFEGAKKRLKEAIGSLKKELELQVHSDGVDYEMSISYQRVILEFLYLPLILQKRGLLKLPREIGQTAEKMTEFMMHMTQPSGFLQPISDADGARVFGMGNDINDFRPHLGLAAWLFGRPDFKFVSEGKIETMGWFLSAKELSDYRKLLSVAPKNVSRAFKKGGYWVSRQNWSKEAGWMFFDCGYMGMDEWDKNVPVGVHGHSDSLNFGLAVGEETFLTDNGSYSYTTERPFHLYFRSAIAHNVPLVDGQDQNIIDARPWLAYQHARPQNATHIFTDEVDYLSGEHQGFLRLRGKIIHQREIMHFKNRRFLIIKDTFHGRGIHEISENFHAMTGLKIDQKKDGVEIIGKKTCQLRPLFESKIKVVKGKTKPVAGWYAPTYGQKMPAEQIMVDFSLTCPGSRYFLISWGKNRPGVEKTTELFESTYQKIKKPRILILDDGSTAASRIQKDVKSILASRGEVKILASSSNQNLPTSEDCEMITFPYIPFTPWQNLRGLLGRKLMSLYYKTKYFRLLLAPFGAVRRYLRKRTFKLIGNDINQPVDVAASEKIVPPKVSSARLSWWANSYYWFYLNQKYFQKILQWRPEEIRVYGTSALLAGYLAKKKIKTKLIYHSLTSKNRGWRNYLARRLADEN